MLPIDGQFTHIKHRAPYNGQVSEFFNLTARPSIDGIMFLMVIALNMASEVVLTNPMNHDSNISCGGN
jgi:hypothetical protein